MKKILFLLAAASVLAACTEKPQTHGLTRNDKAPFVGTGKSLQDTGWKTGDKASWEEHPPWSGRFLRAEEVRGA